LFTMLPTTLILNHCLKMQVSYPYRH
jgi:hypothetical protein